MSAANPLVSKLTAIDFVLDLIVFSCTNLDFVSIALIFVKIVVVISTNESLSNEIL